MKVIVRFTLVTLFTVSLFACKKNVSTQTRFIPKNAAFVASINVGSLKDKLMKDQLTLENMFVRLSLQCLLPNDCQKTLDSNSGK